MEAQVGRVKWFNKQKGYGFLTVSNESGDVDTFVHHSSINVGDSSFRYLVPGEYVSFTQKPMEGDKVCASDVTGVNGGKLTCETQRHFSPKGGSEKSPPADGEWTSVTRRPSGGRGRGRGGRGGSSGRGRGRGRDGRPARQSEPKSTESAE